MFRAAANVPATGCSGNRWPSSTPSTFFSTAAGLHTGRREPEGFDLWNIFLFFFPLFLPFSLFPSSSFFFQVRGVEVGIVVLVLIFWAGAIALFFNRWGKIRMLLPYQPDYKEQLKVPGTGVCAAANAAYTQHPTQHTCSQVTHNYTPSSFPSILSFPPLVFRLTTTTTTMMIIIIIVMIFDIRYSRCIGNSCELTFPAGEKQPIDRSFPIVVFRVKNDISVERSWRFIIRSDLSFDPALEYRLISCGNFRKLNVRRYIVRVIISTKWSIWKKGYTKFPCAGSYHHLTFRES